MARVKPSRLSAKERATLEGLLEERNPNGALGGSITRLHGFLTAVISGPLIAPSEWIRGAFGDLDDCPWDSMEQAQRAMDLLMRFYNEIATDLQDQSYRVLLDAIGDPPNVKFEGGDWAHGYVLGTALRRDEWDRALTDPASQPVLAVIFSFADPPQMGADGLFSDRSTHDEFLGTLAGCAVSVYEWWRSHDANAFDSLRPYLRDRPKISPNAPCACGSGKKYKRCCSPVRAIKT